MGFAAAQFERLNWQRPAPTIEHRRLGTMQASFRRGSEQFVWACLDLVETPRGLADLEFEADAAGPGIVHEQQLDAVVADLDALNRAAIDAICARLPDCSMSLEWQGARLSGHEGRFQLHYWCKPLGDVLVTVRFDHSRPTGVKFDD